MQCSGSGNGYRLGWQWRCSLAGKAQWTAGGGDGAGIHRNDSSGLRLVRARLGAAQSGLGRGLTAIAGQSRLNRGHGLLSWQCERNNGSAVANGGNEQTVGATGAVAQGSATAAAEAGMRMATAGMSQEEYGEGEYEVTD